MKSMVTLTVGLGTIATLAPLGNQLILCGGEHLYCIAEE